jgi:hypothetical protein
MPRNRWPPLAGSGGASRGYFPRRALDHGKQLFSLLALREIHRDLHTCHAANRLLQRSRRLAIRG